MVSRYKDQREIHKEARLRGTPCNIIMSIAEETLKNDQVIISEECDMMEKCVSALNAQHTCYSEIEREEKGTQKQNTWEQSETEPNAGE